MRLLLPLLAFLSASAATPATPTAFVYAYAGLCDASGWKTANFDDLPACDKAAAPDEITARKGLKLRNRLPAAGEYGDETGRLRAGQKVKLVTLHRMAGPDPLPGPKVFWAEIVAP